MRESGEGVRRSSMKKWWLSDLKFGKNAGEEFQAGPARTGVLRPQKAD